MKKPLQDTSLNFPRSWFHQSHWCLVTITTDATTSVTRARSSQLTNASPRPVASPEGGQTLHQLQLPPPHVCLLGPGKGC